MYRRWKGHVKELVYNYHQYKRCIREFEESIAYKSSVRDEVVNGEHIDYRPCGGGTSDKTQQRAFELMSDERINFLRKAVAAVDYAIYVTERKRGGTDMMKIIKAVYWDKTHTLYGAAMLIPISERQVKNWNADFLHLVAQKMGFV